MSLPPREVPEGLSAEGYLELGQEYIKIGWTEQARDALHLAIELAAANLAEDAPILDTDATNLDLEARAEINRQSSTEGFAKIDAENRVQILAGKSAARLLRSKIPKFPVPLYAEQMNIEGHNQMSKGNLEAARTVFEQLIDEYPDFEWPYGNLSVLLLQAGETGKAKELLDRALSINQYYVQGWLHLATARGLELDFDGARACVEKALEIDPTEGAALAVKDALDRMREL